MNTSTVRVERALQVCMSLFSALAALVLGMGEGSYVIPVLGAIACVGALYLTDVRGWLRLNNRQANLAGLVTVGICFWELRLVNAEQRVLALANLLFYLNCVNLFRQKEPRIYWMLMLLNVLEVAVAAALNSDMLFGWLMVLFFFVGLATLALFLVLRENAEQNPSFGGAPAGRCASVEDFLSWALTRQLLRVGFGTLALMGLMFIVMPRADSGDWDEWSKAIGSPHRTVGFEGSRINLSDADDATEDPAEVMRVRLFHHDSKMEYELIEPLLLRGSVLTEYTGEKGKGTWTGRGPARGQQVITNANSRKLQGLIEVECVIKPLGGSANLFAVFPFLKVSSSGELFYDPEREMLFRRARSFDSEFQYNLVSETLKDNRQAKMVACENEPRTDLAQLTLDQQGSLVNLKRVAADVVQGIPVDDARGRAEALERHLRDADLYHYALQPPRIDPNSDPIENFITNSKTGHCEYFASALALMLRSQGIPARIAMGFKTDEYNKLGHFYYVRQLHAHSWVEAYISEAQLPTESRGSFPQGAWLQLDPTPAAAGAETAEEKARRLPTLREIADFTKYLWSAYVVGLNAQKQREAIYQPIADIARNIVSPTAWRESLAGIRNWIRGEDAAASSSTREDLALAVATVLLTTAIYLGVKLLLRWSGRSRARSKSDLSRRSDRAIPVIAFYRRFEQLLARRNLVRAAGQTQREFAIALGGHLADRVETHAAVPIPRQVVDAFYRVRFGEEALDNVERDGVEQALDVLERALKGP